MAKEFEEIQHSGGKVTFNIKIDEEGKTCYQIGFSGSSPVPPTIIGIYALPQGIPMGTFSMLGLWQNELPSRPHPDCFPVFVASDSEGHFGHHCPSCSEYWRSGPFPNLCPYCLIELPSHQFLSKSQLNFVHHYCLELANGLAEREAKSIELDLDKIVDSIGDSDIPSDQSLKISEESQQCKFSCKSCGEFNDILGRFSCCSLCGTRNDLDQFVLEIESLRSKVNAGEPPEKCVKDAVGAFDSYLGQISKIFFIHIPMTKTRNSRLQKQRFHNIQEVKNIFESWFDIKVCNGISESDMKFIEKMFHRRHVYEHNGGEVDQKYLDDSKDTTVRLKQHIHETQEDAHKTFALLVKMARNTHKGFHDIFPPIPEPIELFQSTKRSH